MTEKKTDTWMPLYIGDYLADTMSFTTEEHGAYVLLLMACWREQGKPLSGRDKDLATITGLSLPRWRACKEKLLAKFQMLDDGGVTHKRAAKEIQRAETVSQSRSEAGKAGAARRWRKDGEPVGNAMADGMANRMANGMANGKAKSEAKASQTDGQPQSQSQVTEPNTTHQSGSTAVAPVGSFATPTMAGAICRAIRAKGVADVNPSSPELLALIAQGVPQDVFEEAAAICMNAKPPKGANYLYGIVKRKRDDAAAIRSGAAMSDRPWDESRSSILAKAAEVGIAPWNEGDLSPNRERFDQYTERVRRVVDAVRTAGNVGSGAERKAA